MEEGIKTISSFNAAERQAAIRQQLSQVDLVTKEKDTAFLLELLLGIVGLLGIGYMYTGLTNAGLVRLIGNWIFLFILWSFFGICATVTFGLGLCAIPIPFVLMVVVAYFSADDLKKSMEAVKGAGVASRPASVGGYIETQPAGADPFSDLERDLYPGIEQELEEDRLDKMSRPSQTPPATGTASTFPDSPFSTGEDDEDKEESI